MGIVETLEKKELVLERKRETSETSMIVAFLAALAASACQVGPDMYLDCARFRIKITRIEADWTLGKGKPGH